MKKIIILLIVLVTITGCSIKNINNMDTNDLVETVMNANINKTNIALKGYKFYLPRGMSLIDDTNSNNILVSNGDKYYLYVDLISYYNKELNSYKINEENKAFYSKILDDNKGYILVTKVDNKYFVEAMYNYGKIEVVSRNYKEAITQSLTVLKSITFNDKVIETLIGTNILKYNTEEFNLLGPTTETVDFLKEYEDVDNEIKNAEEQELEIAD